MKDKNEKMDRQEEKVKGTVSEIKEIYGTSIGNLEENTKEQLKAARELKEGLKDTDFDKNIKELKALRDEIANLKSEIARLNDRKDISLSSLIIKDIKTIGEKLLGLQAKAADSIKNLYENMKNQLSYNLTKTQEKLVQAKISIVKGLVNTMQDFIKNQQQKLNACMEKLDSLAEEIREDEKKSASKDKGDEEKGKEEKEKTEEIPEKSAKKEQKKNAKKEKQAKRTAKKAPKKTGTKENAGEQPKKGINAEEKAEDTKLKRKPSVLQALKENQKKIIAGEKKEEEKAGKKDKGMEI